MEEFYMMWLSRCPYIGYKRICKLMDHFHSAEAIWNATEADLQMVKGLREKDIDSILFSRDAEQLDIWIEELEEWGIQFYSYLHPAYPALLKEIYDPPVGLYVRGTLPEDDIDTVAIIGARNCTRYGLTAAYTISKDLGRTNVIVVSGMAKGIDGAAHKGILDAGGRTIAVLGCGLDICYPAEHKELMERIINNGCVISEFPPGTVAHPKHFPRRNRIISGLSKMVVVVEAGKKSGTLITADFALENGRDVFVVPGNVTSDLSEGTNNLIKQGCPIITEGNDILEELGIAYSNEEKDVFFKKIRKNLAPEQKAVYDVIPKQEPIFAEQICRILHKNIQDVQYILSMLEALGHIEKLPQSGYCKK
ncbi:DNA-processing protein DprA [Chakrabartyella piscis]|uniref:DNA-processing protein DprA n=1 Tax=Chakrabartyella piscis TaxID=2918914 RepID=UPI0029588BB9|nr:DNA-processing protein DprA [Chakrabartyella piscis]